MMAMYQEKIVLFATLLIVIFVSPPIYAEVPGEISYQGKLTDTTTGTPVPNGSYTMRFQLFNTATGGTQLWDNSSGGQSVTVTGGIYNVQLGAVQPLDSTIFDGGDVWLGVEVYNTNTTAWETLIPRQRVVSTAYALKAGDADTLEGTSASEFASNVHVHDFSNVSGLVTDDQIPDTITINYASSAGLATSATTAGNADTVDGEHASAFANATHAHPFIQVTGSAIDSQIPNDITINYATSAGNSDTVDGQHASAFMLADVDNWINESGEDHMAGRLEVENQVLSGSAWVEAIKGTLLSPTNGAGVNGLSYGTDAHGVHGSALGTSGRGVYGEAPNGQGVGVYGTGLGSGVMGESSGGIGRGVYGRATGALGIGVLGVSTDADGVGVYGIGPKWAGYFDNNIFIDGSVYSTNGFSFFNANDNAVFHTGWRSDFGDYTTINSGYAWGDGEPVSVVAGANGVFFTKGDASGTPHSTTMATITSDGRFICNVLEITGGMDLAEPFNILEAKSVRAGTLMAIDSEHPGHLKVASKAYDTRIAGVVSGAGGIKPGVILTQDGASSEGTLPIALSGRVFCLADATSGPIKPGDMLTSSDTPGYAMKAVDRDRSHGAIIGKAMTALEKGVGKVLVLVSLQ